MEEDNSRIEIEEVRGVIKLFKKGKAAGHDWIKLQMIVFRKQECRNVNKTA